MVDFELVMMIEFHWSWFNAQYSVDHLQADNVDERKSNLVFIMILGPSN